MNRKPAFYKTKKGFTLIELLVVMAILITLAGTLFPTFSSAKDSARKSQDLSQLRQIVQGMMIYTSNNEGYYPPHRSNEKPGHLKADGSSYAWPCQLTLYSKSPEIFFSPADTNIKQYIKKINKEMEAGKCLMGRYCSWGYNYSHFDKKKDTHIKYPTNTLLLANSTYYSDRNRQEENVGYYEIDPPSNKSLWQSLSSTFKKESAFGKGYGHVWPRHHSNTICNAAFADGHVSSLNIDQFKKAELWDPNKEWLLDR